MRSPRHQRPNLARRFAAGHAGPAPLYVPLYLRTRAARRRVRQRTRTLVRIGLAGAVILMAHAAQARLTAGGTASRPSTASSTVVEPPASRPDPEAADTPPAAPASDPVRLQGPTAARDRVAAFVQAVRPRRGPRYARFLSRVIRTEARRNRLPPLVVAATAYVESEFNKESGPCIGVMQVYPPNLRWLDRGEGLDPDMTRDNVALGVRELASYYRVKGRRPSLRRMWGRYNGCGPGGEYVERALRVLHRLRVGDERTWRHHLRTHGPLWAD